MDGIIYYRFSLSPLDADATSKVINHVGLVVEIVLIINLVPGTDSIEAVANLKCDLTMIHDKETDLIYAG